MYKRQELEEIRKREERKDRLHQNYLKRKASGCLLYTSFEFILSCLSHAVDTGYETLHRFLTVCNIVQDTAQTA